MWGGGGVQGSALGGFRAGSMELWSYDPAAGVLTGFRF